MKAPEWLKELRAWMATAALLGLLVLVYLYVRQTEADRREREALLRYIRETTPQEHIERVRKAAQENAARDRAVREAEGK